MKFRILPAAAALALASTGALAQNSNQGVSKTEITLGSIQDLSGPIAGFGKQVRLGMMLRVDEVNEQGGIHGRKIVLKVEDSAYDPKKAVLAAQKLVNQDKIFAMVGHIGTAQNLATFPVLFEKNIINFFPVTAAREMYEPFNRLKYSFAATYFDQMRLATPKLVKEKSAKKVCAMYQDDEFGLEVLRGAEEGLKDIGMTMAEKTSYKRGATDFSSQVAKMKASGCDMVVLGTIIRETIGAIGDVAQDRLQPHLPGLQRRLHRPDPQAGRQGHGRVVCHHDRAEPVHWTRASQPIRFWANKYKTKFNEDPTVFSVYGYDLIDAFLQAAQKAGPT
jgi:branched-chain amino acid transport system substrate-binding protein